MQISYKSPNSLHQPWWANSELSWDENGLLIDNAPVADLAAEIGTPLYLYSASSIRKRIAELRHALTITGSK
ncbi:MAG: hypothetical protein NTV34_03520, partial [Proteobacteria bacterium]|nr:hypothetical protein [Pseudomonadota bacterium]